MTLTMMKLQAFISDMNWTKEEAIAQFHYVLCIRDRQLGS